MPRCTRTARRGRRPADETPPPTCPHCGNDGHISSLCPRTSYSTSAPALTCRSCVHKVQSAQEGDAPYGILHLIIPCSDHFTTTNPPRDTSDGAAPTQDASVTDPSPPQASRGSWRPQRLIAECQLLYPEALSDRITEDNAEKHADVLRIAKDLLSMNGTREQLRSLHTDNPSGVLKPLLKYE